MKANNNSPAIRFAGFTAPWERRKLKDYLVRYDNLRIPVSSSKRVPGSTPYYGANGIQDYVEGYTHDGQFILVAEDGANDLKNYPVQYVFGKVWVNNHAHVLQAIESIADNLFFKYSISQTDIEPFLVGGGRAKLNAETMMNIETSAPTKAEQVSIGLMLGRLDNLITYHQRKYEKLVNLKKAMLDKMFPKNGELVPEVRFAGFSGNWERRKLGEIAYKVTEKNYAEAISETFTNSAENGIISQREYFDHDISNPSNLAGYFVVQENDFIYNPRISSTAPVGPVNRNKLNRKGLVSPIYTVFRTYEIDNLYLEYFFKTRHWHPYMFYNGDSGARSDRFSIKDSLFMSMPIVLPSQSEQKSIGRFLECVDSIIMLQHQKLERLQNLKKAFLEKMFV